MTESGVSRLCAGKSAFSLRLIVLFWCQKRTRKPPAIERLGGGEAMKAPVGLSSRQSGLRSKCRVFSAARTGIHEKGAARPFQTPKGKSKRKKASRFAKTGCGAQRPLRALSGTRVLLTAAPTAPPCIRRRRRSSLLRIFLCFSHLRLRRRFYLSAELHALQERNTSCEAASRRNEKKAFSAAASFFPFRHLLRDYQGRAALDSCLPRLESSGCFSGSLLARKRELSPTATTIYPAPPARNPT